MAQPEALARGAETLRLRHGDEGRHPVEFVRHWTEKRPPWKSVASGSTNIGAFDFGTRDPHRRTGCDESMTKTASIF